jgi:hypothetical protein
MTRAVSPLRIRRADLKSDKAALVNLFQRCLVASYDGQRFDWLYFNNPHGPAQAWVAETPESGELAGAAAGFPRKMYCEGKEVVGLVLGDFCMSERFRSLGPALLLQRACLEGAQESPFEFFYDFPSGNMMAVYKRMGVLQSGALKRWAKPIRAERVIQRVLKSKGATRMVSGIVDFVLAQRGWKGSKDACELRLHEGLCGEAFTVLDEGFRERPGLRTSRSAEYLNWRYLADPSNKYEIVTAYREDTLAGCAALTGDGEDWAIADLWAKEDAVAARLLGGAETVLRERGAATISLNAGETHPWNSLFERAGFRQRESCPVVAHTSPKARISDAALRDNWYLMRGERDS